MCSPRLTSLSLSWSCCAAIKQTRQACSQLSAKKIMKEQVSRAKPSHPEQPSGELNSAQVPQQQQQQWLRAVGLRELRAGCTRGWARLPLQGPEMLGGKNSLFSLAGAGLGPLGSCAWLRLSQGTLTCPCHSCTALQPPQQRGALAPQNPPENGLSPRLGKRSVLLLRPPAFLQLGKMVRVCRKSEQSECQQSCLHQFWAPFI